jgi:hypothetical protein
VDAARGLVQRVGVEALVVAVTPVRCSRTLSRYSIILEGFSADRLRRDREERARVLHPHNATGATREEVVHVDLALDDAELRRVGEVDRVERAAPQHRLHELQVHGFGRPVRRAGAGFGVSEANEALRQCRDVCETLSASELGFIDELEFYSERFE